MKKSDIQNVISLMNRNDSYCQGSPQQVANAFYRVVDMLVIFLESLDESGKYKGEIKNITSLLERNNRYCQGAAQQSANGSYRVVELLDIMEKLFDEKGEKRVFVKTIVNAMNSNNNYCQGAPQQMANGTYRIAEMLQIIIPLLKPDLETSINSLISEMNRSNSYCQGAPQQTANGTAAIVYMVKHLTEALDEDRKYSSQISSIINLRERNNGYCQGADQQSANNLYRTLELMEIIGNMRIAKLEIRVRKYWEEHAEEKTSLLQEKSDLNIKIHEIEKEAQLVNDGGEIRETENEISRLRAQKNAYGKRELDDIRNRINQLESDYRSIGFFKFSDKKVARTNINAVEAEFSEKEREVKKEQDKIESEIKTKQTKIEQIKKKVENEKNIILKGRQPHQRRISEIDFELTRQR